MAIMEILERSADGGFQACFVGRHSGESRSPGVPYPLAPSPNGAFNKPLIRLFGEGGES